jgi:hypothetical protein
MLATLFDTTRRAVLLVCNVLNADAAMPVRLKRENPLPPKSGSQAPCHAKRRIFAEKTPTERQFARAKRQSLPVAAVRAPARKSLAHG